MTNNNGREGRSAQVGLPSRFAFGVGDFSFNVVWQGTSLFLLYFYTDVLGISPSTAGMIYLAAMVWDAVTDPVAAILIDRVNTAWGRYRPFLLFGAVPFGLVYPAAFSEPAIPGLSIEAWALITHLALRTVYTLVGVPFSALQGRLTDDPDERSVLAGFRMVGAGVGALCVVFFTPTIVSSFAGLGEARAYFLAASIGGASATAALLYAFFVMREPAIDQDRAPRGSLLGDIIELPGMLIRNRPLLFVFGFIVIASVCLAMFGKNVLYFFKYNVERPDLAVWALTMPAFALLVGAPFWSAFSIKTSKAHALRVGASLGGIGYAAFLVVPADNVALLFVAIGTISVGMSAVPVMFWAMLPDTVEYGEMITGRRQEAKIFGFATFAQKVAVGVNAVVLGFLLSIIGFEPNELQTERTLVGLKLVMTLIPLTGTVLMVVMAKAYSLDRERHNEITARLVAQNRAL